MSRAPRRQVPGATMHSVARCNTREFCCTTPENFGVLLAKLRGMAMPVIPAGRQSPPRAAWLSWRGTAPAVGVRSGRPWSRGIKHLDAKTCPVPLLLLLFPVVKVDRAFRRTA